MSIRSFSRVHVTVSDLSLWRKLVLAGCLVLFIAIGFMAAFLDLRIYYSSPNSPVANTGEINRVYVMHGSPRFVTASTQASLDLWRETAARFVGIPFLVAFVVLATSPKRDSD